MTGHPRPVKVLPKDPRGDHPSATELKAKKEEVKVEPIPVVPVVVPLVPLTLKYQYVGQCPICRGDVKSIEVELGKKNLMIAYCIRDDKKLLQTEVIPIKEQFVDDTFEKQLKPGKKYA